MEPTVTSTLPVMSSSAASRPTFSGMRMMLPSIRRPLISATPSVEAISQSLMSAWSPTPRITPNGPPLVRIDVPYRPGPPASTRPMPGVSAGAT